MIRKYKIKRQTLYTGDCVAVLKRLKRDSVDVVVTSPPYNLNIAYGVYADNKSEADYIRWLSNVFFQLKQVLKQDGHCFLNLGHSNANPLTIFKLLPALIDCFGLILQNTIVWVKSIAIQDITYGHFKPLNSKRYLNNNFEYVFHLTKTGNAKVDRLAVGVPFMDKTNIKRRKHSQDKRCAGNVWFIPYRTVQSKQQKFNHPAGFPEEIPERCIKLHGGSSLTVLDPFMGTGTTLVAAEKLGHKGIGIDLDKTYVNAAIKRLNSV